MTTLPLLVCATCSHPLCGAAAVLRPAIPHNKSAAFAYSFTELLGLPEAEAPWCYRLAADYQMLLSTETLRFAVEPTAPTSTTVTTAGDGAAPSTIVASQEAGTEACDGQQSGPQPHQAAVGTGTAMAPAESDRVLLNRLVQEYVPNAADGSAPPLMPAALYERQAKALDVMRLDRPATCGSAFRERPIEAPTSLSSPPAVPGSPLAVGGDDPLPALASTWFVGYACAADVHCAGCGSRAGWRFASTTCPDDSFYGIVTGKVREREWSVADFTRQALLAAAVARRDALALVPDRSGVASPTSSGHPLDGLDPETETAVLQLMDATMAARVDDAAAERGDALRLKMNLLSQLLDKHREQASVLTTLLRSLRERMNAQEEKLSTYEQIFSAHKQQLQTQGQHIGFQDELLKALREQSECQQRQIDGQQRILHDQNTTIGRQNTHLREAQDSLKALVGTHVRIKQYLHFFVDGTGRPATEPSSITSTDATSATATAPPAARAGVPLAGFERLDDLCGLRHPQPSAQSLDGSGGSSVLAEATPPAELDDAQRALLAAELLAVMSAQEAASGIHHHTNTFTKTNINTNSGSSDSPTAAAAVSCLPAPHGAGEGTTVIPVAAEKHAGVALLPAQEERSDVLPSHALL